MITTEFLSYAARVHAILPHLVLVRRIRICYLLSGLSWLYEISHGKVIQSDCVVGFRRYWGVRIYIFRRRGKAKETRRVKTARRLSHPSLRLLSACWSILYAIRARFRIAYHTIPCTDTQQDTCEKSRELEKGALGLSRHHPQYSATSIALPQPRGFQYLSRLESILRI